MKISISLKLIFMMAVVVLVTAVPLTQQTTWIFEQSARRVAEEHNLSLARQRAEEVEALAVSYIEKAKTVASFMVAVTPDTLLASRQAIDSVFNLDKSLIGVELYESDNQVPFFIKRELRESRLADLGGSSQTLDLAKKADPLPIANVVRGGYFVKNLNVDKTFPAVAVGAPLSSGTRPRFVVVYFALSRLQSLFQGRELGDSFVVDSSGRVLAHTFEKFAIERMDFRTHPTVSKSVQDSAPAKQVRFEHPENQQTYLSAYSRSRLGMTFVTETNEERVLAPVREVQRKAIHIAGILLAVALVLVVLFANSMINPIEILVGVTREIGRGHFDIHARKATRAKDEIGQLAEAIDSMVVGLKERDKVKNLFSKFHGSDVAEEMIAGEVALKGANRDVTVFFSDIRGFTAFSEGHTPEEVVEMLNEYFDRMVHIITRNHGVVDKFIGDAIMAIWGAPRSTGEDTYWCVKACLEMRIALAELNQLRAGRGQTPIMVGMGVHSGPAISGTIGSLERMEYTVIGDTVNQTSRIESSTKAFGTDLLLSNEAAAQVSERFWIEEAGRVEVKGKSEPLTLFKVKGRIDADGSHVEVATPFSSYQAEKADKVKMAR